MHPSSVHPEAPGRYEKPQSFGKLVHYAALQFSFPLGWSCVFWSAAHVCGSSFKGVVDFTMPAASMWHRNLCVHLT